MTLSADKGTSPINVIAVAIDKDKYSQYAVKWAIDHLMTSNDVLILLHVQKSHSGGDVVMGAHDSDPQQIFIPFRGYCTRKMVKAKEVLVEDFDVSKALLEYINNNFVGNIVLGATSRNALMKTFKKPDVPSTLTKSAPDFCSVYVIARSKVVSVRSATRPISNPVVPPKHPQFSAEHAPADEISLRAPSGRLSNANERLAMERYSDSIKGSSRQWAQTPPGSPWKMNPSMESIDLTGGPISARNSVSDDDVLDTLPLRNSIEMANRNSDFSNASDSSRSDGNSPLAGNAIEIEMRRLRLELKQTMDMYSSACKEAIVAKQKAKEINEWKSEELQRYDQTRLSEEQVLAIVEMEKAKCRAAMEATEAAKNLAEQEVQKRRLAEMRATMQETNKTDRCLTKFADNDVRYRKYTIEEIEVATEKFASKFKVGEGGYGPVFKGILDHTPVAIKILRPDAAQGRKQFQQEVEVLSSMRHPHMVLLLGACPEYGCLVYEYMNNGSLEDRLLRRGGTPAIPWKLRFRIAAEIGATLTFLHQAKPEPLVHRDLKPANILLDRNYVSKISDVGLARLVPPSVANSVTQYHMTSAAGTFCYIDPEYQQTGMLTTKSDVYSFGVMLLQIITAKPPMGLTHQVEQAINKGTFSEILDPAVHDWPVEEALIFAKMALKCCELRKKDRPDLATVVLPELNRLSELGMGGDANYFFSNYSPNLWTSCASGSRPRLPWESQASSTLSQGSARTGPWVPSESSDDGSTGCSLES